MENENGRQPHFFLNVRRPQFFLYTQARKLIFGMQPYLDPTRWNMEGDLNIFENQRRPQFVENGKQPNFWENGRQCHFFINWRWHQFYSKEDTLNIIKNGRWPQKNI